MSRFSVTALLGAALLVSLTGTVAAQTTASTGPAAGPVSPAVEAVLNECSLRVPGTCVTSTNTYLTGLSGQALPTGEFSQSLADFVVQLAALAQQDNVCDKFDVEIGNAISASAEYATDQAQREQILQIAKTIGECGNFQTASIAPLASPN